MISRFYHGMPVARDGASCEHHRVKPFRYQSALLMALVFTAIGVAGGCGGDATRSDTVRLAISSNPKSLDPAQMTDVNSGDVGAKIYSGLVRFNGLVVASDLAETWTISPDGLVYRFRVRSGVLFHNGRLLTARDVAASLTRIMDPAVKSPRRWVLDAVDTVTATSDDDVMIRLKAPTAAFLSLLAMPACYIVPIEEVARWGEDYGHHAVGSGPYRLAAWEDDRRVVLERHDGYWGGAPAVARIEYQIIPEPLTQIALLKRGQLDVCEIPDVQLPRLAADPAWRDCIQTGEQPATGYIVLNTERFPDPRVRRAFNLAVDRARIIAAVRGGLATPATGPVPPSLMPIENRTPTSSRKAGAPAVGGAPPRGTNASYDPAAARALLAEAGYRADRPIILLRNAPRGTLEPAEAVAGYLRDIGVPVRVEAFEFSSLMSRLNHGDFDMALLNWFADYPDAENFLVPLFHTKNIGGAGNRARLADKRLDDALDRVTSLPAGAARDAAIFAAVDLVTDTAPWIFLWYPKIAVAVSPRLSGYTLPLIFNGEKGDLWSLAPRPASKSTAPRAVSSRATAPRATNTRVAGQRP